MGKFVRQPPEGFEEVLFVAGGEVDEYRISLGFYGDEIDPHAITAALGRSPTSASVKGDIVHKNDRSRVVKTGNWLLNVNPAPGESLSPTLEALFNSLTMDLSVWREVTTRFKHRFVVSAWIRS